MIDLFGDVREAVQLAPSEGTALGEIVFALRYLDVIRQATSSEHADALGHEHWRRLHEYTRAALSRSSPPESRASHWDIVSFCLDGAHALEERACSSLWGQSRDVAIRDVRHWLASFAWAMGSGAPRALLHSSISSTNFALHASWSSGQSVIKLTSRPSPGFVRDQWIARGDGIATFPGLPDHLYRSLFRASRHADARRKPRNQKSSSFGGGSFARLSSITL